MNPIKLEKMELNNSAKQEITEYILTDTNV
jgi:hypothetical protein